MPSRCGRSDLQVAIAWVTGEHAIKPDDLFSAPWRTLTDGARRPSSASMWMITVSRRAPDAGRRSASNR